MLKLEYSCFFSGGERENFIQVPALEKLMAVSSNLSVTIFVQSVLPHFG